MYLRSAMKSQMVFDARDSFTKESYLFSGEIADVIETGVGDVDSAVGNIQAFVKSLKTLMHFGTKGFQAFVGRIYFPVQRFHFVPDIAENCSLFIAVFS